MSGTSATRVAIVGAGRGGTALLRVLLALPEVEVVGVADPRDDAPGIVLAREKHVPTCRDFCELLARPVDVIIEATGVSEVAGMIARAKSPRTSMADAAVARIMWLLVERHLQLDERVQAEIMTRAQDLAGAAGQLSQAVRHLDASSAEVSRGARQVADTAAEATRTLENAARVLEAIQDVLQFVRNVADTTKLLGLNAAIEAAHAGAHQGAGFAVVAQEVRKLADDTSNSANQIGQIVQEVNLFLNETVEAVRNVAAIARDQASATSQVAGAVSSMAAVVSSLADTSRELAELSSQIASGATGRAN